MSFDLVAPHYCWLETVGFGSVLQKARARWIETVPQPKRVLTIGEGTGHFVRKFLHVHRGSRGGLRGYKCANVGVSAPAHFRSG